MQDPISIVGIGCKLPGGISSPRDLVTALQNGRDCITEIPPDRWSLDTFYDADPNAPGKMYTRHGGFASEIDRFDAAFFGISESEAKRMDPQQRILLETVWQALEHAGQSPDDLMQSDTGVFLGMIIEKGYQQLRVDAEGLNGVTAFDTVADAACIAAGRISHAFGLEGPCLTVDTACSSSLVAVHLACQSLQSGECDTAIVAGVSTILHPYINIAFSKLELLARDGRCKAFDARADGYVRGEGCVVVVLRKQSVALARSDYILANIIGTAINQDGRTAALTAPNGRAQERVMKSALFKAGLDPATVGFVEAHGTGTALGDPIEMASLVNVFGPGRSATQPLYVGSIKSNVGHLEGAAGLLGLVKAALSLDQEQLFPNLHFSQLNPRINLGSAPFYVPTRTVPWGRGQGSRVAGVNSFGYSGTNAHAILQESPLPFDGKTLRSAERTPEIVVISAKSEQSLRLLVQRWIDFLESDDSTPLHDIAFTAGAGRAHLNHRLAVVARSRSEIVEKLRSWQAGRESKGLAIGSLLRRKQAAKMAFVFGGEGAQYAGMGRQLYDKEPRFRASFDRCAAILESELGVSIHDLIFGEALVSRAADTRCAQSASFVIEYALADLLRYWGVEPNFLVGHGVGEIVAACVAEMLELKDSLRLVAAGFDAVADSLRLAEPKLPIVSGFTGDFIKQAGWPSSYWTRSEHETGPFHTGMTRLLKAGCTVFVELSPDPVLLPAWRRTDNTSEVLSVATLTRNRDDIECMLETLAALYSEGVSLRFERLFKDEAYRRAHIPLYAFQRDRHWFQSGVPKSGSATDVQLHPLLGVMAEKSSSHEGFRTHLSAVKPWIDHRVLGSVVFPATAYLDMASRGFTVSEGGVPSPVTLHDVRFEHPLVLEGNALNPVHLAFNSEFKHPLVLENGMPVPSEAGPGDQRIGAAFSISAVTNERMVCHCRGQIAFADDCVEQISVETLLRDMPSRLDPETYYTDLRKSGFEYGCLFSTVRELWLGQPGSGQALGRIHLCDPGKDADVNPFLQSILLDGCLQVTYAAMRTSGHRGNSDESSLPAADIANSGSNYVTLVPARVHRMVIRKTLPDQVWSHVTIHKSDANGSVLVRIRVLNDTGEVLVDINALELSRKEDVAVDHKEALASGSTDLLAAVQEAPEEKRLEIVIRWLQAEIKDTIGPEAESLDPTEAFIDLGMDSLLMTDLQRRLQKKLAFSLPPMQGLAVESIESLGRFLLERVLCNPQKKDVTTENQSQLANVK